jgi:hypothetical protein
MGDYDVSDEICNGSKERDESPCEKWEICRAFDVKLTETFCSKADYLYAGHGRDGYISHYEPTNPKAFREMLLGIMERLKREE